MAPAPSANPKLERPAPEPPLTFTARQKWAVVIGIGQFQNSEWTISYAAKDAKDFKDYLVNNASFAENQIKLLLDRNATKVHIFEALDWLGKQAKDEDLALIYLRTRGALADRSAQTREFLALNYTAPRAASAFGDNGFGLVKGKDFLATYDSDPDSLEKTGIEMVDFADNVRQIVDARATIIVIDSDFSGTVWRGIVHFGSSFINRLPQGRLFSVVASCNDKELSWQSDKLKNSVFTRALIDALIDRGQTAPFLEAAFSTRERVQHEVQEVKANRSQLVLTGGMSSSGPIEVILPNAADSKP